MEIIKRQAISASTVCIARCVRIWHTHSRHNGLYIPRPGRQRVRVQNMIQRIPAASKMTFRDETNHTWVTVTGSPLKGGFMAGLHGFALKAPTIQNANARFYFAEKGWHEIGKPIVAQARHEGHTIRVCKRKNPTRSQIVYLDEFQVAILPRKDIPRKRKK
jgi:hypothetical protein